MQEIALPHVYIDDIWQTVLSIQKGAEAYAQEHSQSHTHTHTSVFISAHVSAIHFIRNSAFLLIPYLPTGQTDTATHKHSYTQVDKCTQWPLYEWHLCGVVFVPTPHLTLEEKAKKEKKLISFFIR